MWTGVYNTQNSNSSSFNNWNLTSETYQKFMADTNNVLILQSVDGDDKFKTVGYEEYTQVAKVNLEMIKKIGVANGMKIFNIPIQYVEESLEIIKWYIQGDEFDVEKNFQRSGGLDPMYTFPLDVDYN
jgi:hypothetical protein